jgi:hypothetical protein
VSLVAVVCRWVRIAVSATVVPVFATTLESRIDVWDRDGAHRKEKSATKIATAVTTSAIQI